MKSVEIERKAITTGKLRERCLRSRNKRKSKRKKNSRISKRMWSIRDSTPISQGHNYPKSNYLSPTFTWPRLTDSGACAEFRMGYAQNIWIRTYRHILQWHCKHQRNYWSQYAQQLKAENQHLKRQIFCPTFTYGCGSNDYHETNLEHHGKCDPFGDTDEENENEMHAVNRDYNQRQLSFGAERCIEPDFDEEFLAFMEVSARHRLEHRRLKNMSA
ncbi:uncharacterized protein LOC128726088 [Anopheles nili]|uniref:uncharacterized protein LOC128726088 n=1 Tax=Anopheles nili TaxID=185578 RepID=UPI00237B4E56|nr:uncharacterized protein LOC128726088 [Anopheles nili]